MGKSTPSSVAIVGGGPGGSALATYLARAGVRVALFTQPKRPVIVIGESLVPAIVPILRDLGVESEVASYSIRKTGATFCFNATERLNIRFDDVRGARTEYSYNVPRDRFDATLLDAAVKAGAQVIEHPAHLVRVPGSDRLELAADSLAAASAVFGGAPPDFIVDAAGRKRIGARLLDLAFDEGPRKDVALHAHHTGVDVEIEGNVHTDRLDFGWAWRIPLPGRVSVGIVVDGSRLAGCGDTLEEQYDTFLRKDSVMSRWIAPATRVTPVVRYSNYQLSTARGFGENWALVGDAFGFIDPVFSSGTLIAFESARDLAGALLSGEEESLREWESEMHRRFHAWRRVVDIFYNGRLLTLFKMGDHMRRTIPGRMMDWHFRKHMPRIFTGEGVTNAYSLGLLTFMAQHALWNNDPEMLRIS
ncbi:MAG TPA: NAD(P)/FAD-dependent oxidoreductase [Candidatus Limnocylindrales bacterium]|nr:NAD(P)/FAD-dependent oxidoreductase [Candidatus Limnocylindrales bacterium]